MSDQKKMTTAAQAAEATKTGQCPVMHGAAASATGAGRSNVTGGRTI